MGFALVSQVPALTIPELETRESELKAELAKVQDQMAALMVQEEGEPDGDAEIKRLDLNGFLVGLDKRAARIRSLGTQAQKKREIEILTEKMHEAINGNEVQQVFKVTNVTITPKGKARLTLDSKSTLPFMNRSSTKRNISPSPLYCIVLDIPEEEALRINPGDALLVKGIVKTASPTTAIQQALKEVVQHKVVLMGVSFYGAPPGVHAAVVYLTDYSGTLGSTRKVYTP